MGCTLSSDKRRLPAEIRKLQKQHFLSKQNSLKKQDQQVLCILYTSLYLVWKVIQEIRLHFSFTKEQPGFLKPEVHNFKLFRLV